MLALLVGFGMIETFFIEVVHALRAVSVLGFFNVTPFPCISSCLLRQSLAHFILNVNLHK
jgi:hypothetical protein